MEKYELLNQNPRIVYVEKDYEGIMGCMERTEREIKIVFRKNASKIIKDKFKRSCVQNILKSKQYDIVEVGSA